MKHSTANQDRFKLLLENYLDRRGLKRLNLETPGTNSLAAWFLGPKAENREFFKKLLSMGVDAHCRDRKDYFPGDPKYITDYRKDEEYVASLEKLELDFNELLDELIGSVPFFSYRYQAHMNWDLTMPGLLGYFSAMLYNQNNVATEASPVTSQLESIVGNDLCKMLGFDVPPVDDTEAIRPWGHITCDGSIANFEGMWAARNLKFYPISLAKAVKNDFRMANAKGLTVEYLGKPEVLINLDTWSLLNLNVDIVLGITEKIVNEYHISSDVISNAVEQYLIQSMGFIKFNREYLADIPQPVVIGTSTKHYSWPKNAAALGIGKNNFIDISVDEDARMSIPDLRIKLDACFEQKQPVIMVVVVLGSTEQSAVDPLEEVLKLRDEYRRMGMEFVVHVDSAWGGYFASILRGKAEDLPTITDNDPDKQYTPALAMSDYVTRQYECLPKVETITIDPHKAGYIPYPAGALCYRNKSMRNLIAFLAPEVYHGSLDANMGVFGIEGSKPGAAAAAVYLSHKTIRPDVSGYGKILGQALFNSKRFFSAVITMADEKDPFIVVPVQQIPAEKEQLPPEEIEKQLQYIKTHIVAKQNNELIRDEKAMALLKELGSDQIIITYGFNFKSKQGNLNTDPVKANEFNQKIFEKFSLSPDSDRVKETPLIITTSEFDPNVYGETFVNNYMRRLGLNTTEPTPTMKFISSTTMCPWLTATEKGNFIPTLIDVYKKSLLDIVKEMQGKSNE
ncbi:MAG: pyridoxal-dependent decarboxylase [Candidatus Aminicenantes bacterium]|nr:pyridoxal-dependent decarboxylase [Candidatus Aminicenantes bacterium]